MEKTTTGTWVKYQYKAAQKSVATCLGKIPTGPKDSVHGRGDGAAPWSLNPGLCELGVRQAKGRRGSIPLLLCAESEGVGEGMEEAQCGTAVSLPPPPHPHSRPW